MDYTPQDAPPSSGGNTDRVLACVPEGLNLSCLPQKWRDYGRYVLGHIHSESRRPDADQDGWVHLSSGVLKTILPWREYRHILDGLISAGVLEERVEKDGRSHRYYVGTGACGGYSKSFRIAPQWANRTFVQVKLTRSTLVKKLTGERRPYEAKLRAPIHRHLRDNQKRLQVAEGFPQESRELTQIRDGKFRFKVCPQGRVHTTLTAVKSKRKGPDRAFLRCDGEGLYQVDVKCSQPFILGMVLRNMGKLEKDKEFREYRKFLGQPLKDNQEGEEEGGTWEESKTCGDIFGELDRFIALCLSETADLYEHMVERAGAPPSKRDDFKKRLLTALYAKPGLGMVMPVGKAFMAAFPALWDRICQIKEGDHGRLARSMQTCESYVVVWRACTRIMHEYPDAPLFVIHDALISTKAYITKFQAILRDEFEKTFGLAPGMKVGRLDGQKELA